MADGHICSTDSGRRIGIGRILICRPVHSQVQVVSAGFPTQPTGRQFPRLCCAEGCSSGWVGLGWAGLLYGFNGLKPVRWLAVLVHASGNI